MNFGERLKLLRTGQKLTQQQLGARLGVAKSVVSYYESGDRFPSYDVLVRLARVVHTTTDYLLGLEQHKTVDVSDLNEDEIAAIVRLIDLFKNNRPDR